MENLIFKPWIPELYNSLDNKYGKLLLLGESHIGNDDNKNNREFTFNVIEDVIGGDRRKDYKHFTFLGNLLTPNDRTTTFENCAFANLIQDVFPGPRIPPNQQQISSISPAFWNLLNITKPNKVIITSSRIWNNWMPNNDSRSYHIGELTANSQRSTIWKYEYNGGVCEAIGIHHPSARNFYSWRPLVQEFLKR